MNFAYLQRDKHYKHRLITVSSDKIKWILDCLNISSEIEMSWDRNLIKTSTSKVLVSCSD